MSAAQVRFSAASSVILLFCVTTAVSGQATPLSISDLEDLLSRGVVPQRVLSIAMERCIDFDPSSQATPVSLRSGLQDACFAGSQLVVNAASLEPAVTLNGEPAQLAMGVGLEAAATASVAHRLEPGPARIRVTYRGIVRDTTVVLADGETVIANVMLPPDTTPHPQLLSAEEYADSLGLLSSFAPPPTEPSKRSTWTYTLGILSGVATMAPVFLTMEEPEPGSGEDDTGAIVAVGLAAAGAMLLGGWIGSWIDNDRYEDAKVRWAAEDARWKRQRQLHANELLSSDARWQSYRDEGERQRIATIEHNADVRQQMRFDISRVPSREYRP